MNITVIGSGYVGTVAAACFASVGHRVEAVETDQAKLRTLRGGKAPFFEPGLEQILSETLATGHLSFTDDFGVAMSSSQVVFICVGTPAGADGHPNMDAMESAARSIGQNLTTRQVVVTKSTVPIGTGRWLKSVIEEASPASAGAGLVEVASNPEFLREGQSIGDFLHPDRVVIGCDDPAALQQVVDVYEPILVAAERHSSVRPPILTTTLTTAEMVKYASNAFLATKISYANEMARICDFVGADITEVTDGMGLDKRIGSQFLDAGLGWGGSCFGKDILALISTAQEYNYHPRLLSSTIAVNDDQRRIVIDQLQSQLKTLRGRKIAILGLAFKPGTDDLRDSASLDIITSLQQRGVNVSANDPMVSLLPNHPTVHIAKTPYEAADHADAVVLATAWPDFLNLDLVDLRRRTRGTLFFDGRNALDRREVEAAGFDYVGIGRNSTY